MINPSPPVLNSFDSLDFAIQVTHFVHGSNSPDVVAPELYARNRFEYSNDRDSLTGVWYPTSQLRDDGWGNLIAGEGPPDSEDDSWLIR